MGTIEQRLEILERHYRRAQWGNRVLAFALAVVICVAGAQLSSPQTPKAKQPAGNAQGNPVPERKGRLPTVEAERIVLLDRLGQTRITLAVTDDGPAISMFDENGLKRLELKQSANAAGIHLFDGLYEAPVASLQIQAVGARAELEIKGSEGRALTRADGFQVLDRDDHPRLQLALINGNFPVLGISHRDQRGPPSVEITAGDNVARAIKIHDEAGRPLFSVSAAQDGRTHLEMRHPNHERLLQISAGPKKQDGPKLEFFASAKPDGTGGLLPRLQLGLQMDQQPYLRIVDSDGKPVFTAPGK